jgi:hypothetical protein
MQGNLVDYVNIFVILSFFNLPFQVLEDQQNGLAHVMKILREDLQDAVVLGHALSDHSK